MRKRWYTIKVLMKGLVLLVVPPTFFLIVVAAFFPPKGIWSWLFWVLEIVGVSGWTGFLAAIAQVLGSTLPQWIGWDVLRVARAFEKTTERTLSTVRDTIPGLGSRLERKETQQVWDTLQQAHSVLIHGESGVGKTGVAAAIVRHSNTLGEPVLFLDTRNYLSIVSNFDDLVHYVGVSLPLRDCLERLARAVGGCVLVVDQLDSAVGTPALQVSTELLAAASILNRVKVVAVSCLLDAPEYQRIRDLQFEPVQCSSLPREEAAVLLQRVGIGSVSQPILTLSENLFYLSLIAELARDQEVSHGSTEVALLEHYRQNLERIEGGDVVESALALAYESLNAGQIDFSLPRKKDYSLQRLQNRGLIIPVGHNLYRFRHEMLLHYFFAVKAIESGDEVIGVVKRTVSHQADRILVWILRLYYYWDSPERVHFLEVALSRAGELEFFERASLLDEIQGWKDPANVSGLIDTILRVVPLDPSLERYFWRHLADHDNLRWFDALGQRGAFGSPPEPISNADSISYPAWPPQWYLISVAPKLPDQIVELAGAIHTTNPYVMTEFVRAACTMPAPSAGRMIPHITRWADLGMPVAKEVFSLTIYLAREGQWASALDLLDLVLSPKRQYALEVVRQSPSFSPQAGSNADLNYLRLFVEQQVDLFVNHRPLEILQIVERNMERALMLEGRVDEDGSMVWRHAIEAHEQNRTPGDFKDLLVDVAVKALRAVVSSMPDEGRRILESYIEHRYSIFRRLAIHTVRLNPAFLPGLWERLFTDPQYLNDIEIYHEHWMLMHDTFDALPVSIRNAVVSRVASVLSDKQEKDGEQYRRQRLWVLRRLWALKDCELSGEHQALLANLASEYGEPNYPAFISYTYAIAGPASPVSIEDLVELRPKETLSLMKSVMPFESFDGPSHEGFADVLRAAIIKDPQHFTAIAVQLAGPDIAPVYTFHALWGFQEAWKENKEFDWEPVLQLCSVVAEAREEVGEGEIPPDVKPGYWTVTYASARRAAVDLLETSLGHKEHTLPGTLLAKARDILLILADDSNPSAEYERQRITREQYGVVDLSLNVIRAKAIEALVRYALYTAEAKAQKQEVPDVEFAADSRMDVAVKTKLTQRLDKAVEPSLSVHSVFGKYLPNLYYLNEEWLLAHLEEILPRDANMLDYWEAAWEGYLLCSGFYQPLYPTLRPYYRFAVEQIALDSSDRGRAPFARGALAQHLATAYWRGVEVLADTESLITLFFDSAPDQVRASFVAGLGRALDQIRPAANSDEWLRAKALWITRSQQIGVAARAQNSLEPFVKELGAYIEWVPFIPEDLAVFYPQIEASALAGDAGAVLHLLEFLSSASEVHGPFTVFLLEKLLGQDRGPWFLVSEYRIIRPVIESVMTTGNEQAHSCAVRVINLFGERGDERYRELL